MLKVIFLILAFVCLANFTYAYATAEEDPYEE